MNECLLMQTDNSNAHNLQDRFRNSSVATAVRASENISNGLGVLGHQLKLPKTASWQGESAWILDGLRYSAIDGLDAQKVLGYVNEAEHGADAQYITKAGRQAKQALLSTASPLAASVALSKNLTPLVSKCNEILNNLQKLIDAEHEAETHQAVHRESPKDNSSPSKKGL